MASRAFTRLLAPLRGATPRAVRPYSTATTDSPPLLQKLKGDLKTAMRAKDAPRLSVLRSIITTTLNASKTANPIRTDVQLVTLLRKSQRACLDAAEEFKAAGREDLAGKEEVQAKIAEEYVLGSGVQLVSEAELKAMVGEAVEAAKAAGVVQKSIMGDVMKRLSGPLEGKDVDRKELANMVKAMTES